MDPALIEIDSQAESVDQPGIANMLAAVQDIGFVAASWQVERTKYTSRIVTGIEQLMTECTILISVLEHAVRNPEATLPSNTVESYEKLSADYEELNEIVTSMSSEKRRRVDADQSSN